MTLIVLGATGFALLCAGGCSVFPQRAVILDSRIPHQLAEETEAWVWGKQADGRMVKVRARLLEGSWVASQEVVEGTP